MNKRFYIDKKTERIISASDNFDLRVRGNSSPCITNSDNVEHDIAIYVLNEESYQQLAQQKALLEDLLRITNDLVEDIETPYRLRLSEKPNANWVALNEVRAFLKKVKNEN